MEQAEKLEILAACDFSGWREVRRGQPESSVSMAVLEAFASVTNLVGRIETEAAVERGRLAYNTALAYYDRIPWERMDSSDNDFRWLFNYREKLQEYARRLENFFVRCEREGFTCSRE